MENNLAAVYNLPYNNKVKENNYESNAMIVEKSNQIKVLCVLFCSVCHKALNIQVD